MVAASGLYRPRVDVIWADHDLRLLGFIPVYGRLCGVIDMASLPRGKNLMSTYARELTDAEIAAMVAGTSYPVIAVNNMQRVGLLVVFGNGCTAGVVALKSAASANFAGAWSEQLVAQCPAAPPGANGTVVTAAVEIVGAVVRPELKTALAGGVITKVVVYVG